MLLYASNGRLEGWGSLDVGGPVELVIWRSVSSLETAPMWVSPTHDDFPQSANSGMLIVSVGLDIFSNQRHKDLKGQIS